MGEGRGEREEACRYTETMSGGGYRSREVGGATASQEGHFKATFKINKFNSSEKIMLTKCHDKSIKVIDHMIKIQLYHFLLPLLHIKSIHAVKHSKAFYCDGGLLSLHLLPHSFFASFLPSFHPFILSSSFRGQSETKDNKTATHFPPSLSPFILTVSRPLTSS